MPPRGDHHPTPVTATDVPQTAVWQMRLMRTNTDKLWLIGGGVLFILSTVGGGGVASFQTQTARQHGCVVAKM